MEKTHSQKLRSLARYMDKRKRIADQYRWVTPSVTIYAEDKADFAKLCRSLGGFEKDAYNGTIYARHEERDDTGSMMFRVEVILTGACEKVPVLDEDGTPKLAPVKKYEWVETGEVEPVTEWKCPESFLNS